MKITNRVNQGVATKPEPRDYRRELWIGVAIGVARAENTKDSTAPGRWANDALAAYDKQFGGSR